MDIGEILLTGLTLPNYSRLEYWQKQQKESGYSEAVFLQMLNDSLDFFQNEINDAIVNRLNRTIEINTNLSPHEKKLW